MGEENSTLIFLPLIVEDWVCIEQCRWGRLLLIHLCEQKWCTNIGRHCLLNSLCKLHRTSFEVQTTKLSNNTDKTSPLLGVAGLSEAIRVCTFLSLISKIFFWVWICIAVLLGLVGQSQEPCSRWHPPLKITSVIVPHKKYVNYFQAWASAYFCALIWKGIEQRMLHQHDSSPWSLLLKWSLSCRANAPCSFQGHHTLSQHATITRHHWGRVWQSTTLLWMEGLVEIWLLEEVLRRLTRQEWAIILDLASNLSLKWLAAMHLSHRPVLPVHQVGHLMESFKLVKRLQGNLMDSYYGSYIQPSISECPLRADDFLLKAEFAPKKILSFTSCFPLKTM